MMLKQINVLSSCAIAATVALFAVALAGCDRREEVYPLEGNAYMHDPEFRAQLDEQVKVRDDLRKSTLKARSELDALVKELGGFAAATNTARGLELAALIEANGRLFVSNRMEVARITRERIKRATEDSKRIARGEAKAIEVEKNLKNKENK